jgi:hypothetical protein
LKPAEKSLSKYKRQTRLCILTVCRTSISFGGQYISFAYSVKKIMALEGNFFEKLNVSLAILMENHILDSCFRACCRTHYSAFKIASLRSQ